MRKQIRHFASWMKKRIGQRGAEMVEYAIVIACIVAVAFAFYKPAAGQNSGDKGRATLNGALTDAWNYISDKVDDIQGVPSASDKATDQNH